MATLEKPLAKSSDAAVSPLARLLERVLARALSITGSESGAVLLVDEDSGDLLVECTALSGTALTEPAPRLLVRGASPRSVCFEVVDEGRPVCMPECDEGRTTVFRHARSHLSVPVSFQERVLGVIAVESARLRAYAAEHVRALSALALEVASAMRSAQLRADASDRSVSKARPKMVWGLSPVWAEVERRIERAAETRATVLLRGESGTGKELAARTIHSLSPRAHEAFVVVNCGAIPEGLLETELFGHVRGAFTGAVCDRIGRFEEAHRGTLFLDEVGELPLPLQVKLLRVLEDGEIHRVGGSGPSRRVDVRIVAATNRPLEKMVADETFRKDLYFRLAVLPIRLPPLREYPEAISLLASSMLREYARAYGRAVREIEPEALAALLAYDFPGNVRELRNAIEQAVVLETGEQLRLESLPDEVRAATGDRRMFGGATYREALRGFERTYVTTILQRHDADVSRAADAAGVHRVHLYRMIRRHGISLPRLRAVADGVQSGSHTATDAGSRGQTENPASSCWSVMPD